MDVGLFSSSTSSVEIGTLGMDLTFSTSFPSSIVSNFEAIIVDAPWDDIINIHEELENFKTN